MPSVADRAVSGYRSVRLRLPQPWSRRFGQLAYSPRLLTGHADTHREFAEEPVIERLALGNEPLEGIRGEFSERVIEIPWVQRRVSELVPATTLDAGTAFAPMIYKWLLLRRRATVETVDLAPTGIAGIAHHLADIRSLPMPDSRYEMATCISTLEHVGMDNTQYDVASGGGGDVDALRELGRVARNVLVTVPGGRDEDMGFQRQYSPARFRRAAEQAGLAVKRLDAFEQTGSAGWNPVDPESITSRTYAEGATAAAAVLCVQLTRST